MDLANLFTLAPQIPASRIGDIISTLKKQRPQHRFALVAPA
jgi:hypothetical protein